MGNPKLKTENKPLEPCVHENEKKKKWKQWEQRKCKPFNLVSDPIKMEENHGEMFGESWSNGTRVEAVSKSLSKITPLIKYVFLTKIPLNSVYVQQSIFLHIFCQKYVFLTISLKISCTTITLYLLKFDLLFWCLCKEFVISMVHLST